MRPSDPKDDQSRQREKWEEVGSEAKQMRAREKKHAPLNGDVLVISSESLLESAVGGLKYVMPFAHEGISRW